MKLRSGQAWKVLGEAAHQLGRIVMLLLILGFGAVCLLAFRLSFGPLELPELASRLATLASGQGISVRMDGAELTWAGYHQGGGMPFVVRLRGISVRNAVGVEFANIPAADMIVPPADLFGARQPLRVDGTGARFTGTTAPVSLRADIWPGSGYTLARGAFDVSLGPGVLGRPGLSEVITGGHFIMQIAPGAVDVSSGQLTLAPVGASAPHIGFTFTARRQTDWRGTLLLTADAVRAQDLPAYWPADAAPHTRAWVSKNITAGLATNAAFTFSLSAPGDLSALHLDDVTGGFTGQDLTLIWLKDVTPITGLNGSFTMPDKDTAIVTAESAHVGGIALTSGEMTITGLAEKDQFGDLSVALASSLPDAVAVLGTPPLDLLRDAPPGLAKATGSVTATVTARIPFTLRVALAETALHVRAALRGVDMVSPLPPLAFAGTDADLDVTVQTLRVQAKGNFAGEPATLTLRQDLTRPDGAQDVQFSGSAGTQIWDYLGVGQASTASGPASGVAPFTVHLTGPAGGAQSATVSADLTAAGIALPAFGWEKAPGTPGQAQLSATVRNGQLIGLTNLSAQAPGLSLSGAAQGGGFVLSRAAIGRTEATGSITPPGGTGAPWQISLSGPVLDVRRQRQASAASPAPAKTTAPSGPLWSANLNFGTLYLAADPAPGLSGFSFSGAGQGGTVLRGAAKADGFSLTITPQTAERRALAVRADDAGALLRTLDAYDSASGGTLALDAQYGAGQPAAGTATLTDVRLVKAPEVTKLLQALTLYGVAEAVSGPGLLIDHAVIPFVLQDGVLHLNQARAFSASLGFTAAGSIRLADDECAIDTTVIPAYWLNSLPGKLPLLGRLFSAEKGGGLIAMRAHVSGKLSNPDVSVNPFSALTPGFLRGLFGLGGGQSAAPP
ncbi:DUF3971 domain-containing protein [Acidocella sp. KAb 2-4]|uniref:DUF3971 domain-containing protein n=1 Tax=Acidocella sp. KAb 2-4 TaxID=2885158 RepID=UPI001D0970C8|nr:DUF3971 domain-containing protein [Acidocella sp. KAb 2-4]MCB5943312.1 DUF3971 domain-containing protein [Acidocella sp. KAb 2-4]